MSIPEKYAHIQGWGADLDHANRPAVPMERTPPRLDHVSPGEPEQQPRHVEVLHSVERPGVSRVFGTSVPPSGLSGHIRRSAFKRSENDIRHWLMLVAADRVNAVEGMLEDLRGAAPRKEPLLIGAALGAVFVAGWCLARQR